MPESMPTVLSVCVTASCWECTASSLWVSVFFWLWRNLPVQIHLGSKIYIWETEIKHSKYFEEKAVCKEKLQSQCLSTYSYNWLGCKCEFVLVTPTCLDDEFGTFIAGEQSHIHGAAFHISTVLVHNGIQLCMAHCGTECWDGPHLIQDIANFGWSLISCIAKKPYKHHSENN